MAKKDAEDTLEFLLAFDGHIHRYAGGYWLKFEIVKVEESEGRPYGLSYSFTLHGPDNRRLIGFDNAHSVPAKGSRFTSARKQWIIGIERKQMRGVLICSRTQKH